MLRHRHAAAVARPALALAAGAAGGRGGRHAGRSLGAAAARLLAVVHGGRPADGRPSRRRPAQPRAIRPAGGRGDCRAWRAAARPACARRSSPRSGWRRCRWCSSSRSRWSASLPTWSRSRSSRSSSRRWRCSARCSRRCGRWRRAGAGAGAGAGLAGELAAGVWTVPAAPPGAQLAACWRAAAACCRCRGGCACWRCRWRCRCCCRRACCPATGGSSSWWPTSARARPCWCARATTCWSTTPGRSTRATATPGSACCCRCCARSARRSIDVLMLSHRDSDHVGGAASLLAALPVRAAPQLAGRRATRCSAGAVPHTPLRGRPALAVGRRGVRGAAPDARPSTSAARKPNALSCVLRVQSWRRAACCSPATSRRSRRPRCVARYGAALRSELLLVPHHGSRSSSSAALLDAVQPQHGAGPGGLPQPLRPPGARGGAALRDAASHCASACGACARPVWCMDIASGVVRRSWHHASAPAPLTGTWAERFDGHGAECC